MAYNQNVRKIKNMVRSVLGLGLLLLSLYGPVQAITVRFVTITFREPTWNRAVELRLLMDSMDVDIYAEGKDIKQDFFGNFFNLWYWKKKTF